jgi:hypothetical protein
MERFNLKKPNDVEVKVLYHVKISNRFAALENLGGGGSGGRGGGGGGSVKGYESFSYRI